MKKILSISLVLVILCGLCVATVNAEESISDDICSLYLKVIKEEEEDVVSEFGGVYAYVYDIDDNGIPDIIINHQELPTASDIYVYTYEEKK